MTQYFLICVSLISVLSVSVVVSLSTNISPGPVVFVRNGGNITFWCTTNSPWTKIIFQDYGIRADGPAVVVFQGNDTFCKVSSVLPGYSALPCTVGQPVGFTIHKITTSYDNKHITCQVNLGTTPVHTVIQTIVPVTSVTISNTPTDENPVKIIKGQRKLFTCKTNAGRPSSKIQWYRASVNITSSASSQPDVCATDCSDGKLISSSQLIYKGNTDDSREIIYCTASNIEGHGIRSSNKTIDVLYFPNIHMEPKYNPYIVYHTQQNIVLTCVIDDANPSNAVTYEWNSPSGTVNSQNFTIAAVDNSHSGQYSCTAKNIAGTSNRTNKQISVHYGPFVTNITKHQNIVEGNNLEVTPIVDANPVAKLIWWTRQNDVNFIYVGSVLRINNITRMYGGNYSCYVLNTLTPSGMDEINSTSQNTFYVNVVFKPVLDDTRPYSPPYVSAAIHNSLHLQLTMNANPTPTIEWKFRTETDWDSCNFITIVSNTTTNSFLTSSSILIDDVQSNIFGEYTFSANNTVGTFFRRFVVMKEAYLTQVKCPITNGNTGIFVSGIVTLVVGLVSLTAAVVFVFRNGLKNKAVNSLKSVEYSDMQRSNPAFTDAYTSFQSNIESTVPSEQTINHYEECGRTPEAHTYSSVDKIESEPSQYQQHCVNTYEECGKRIDAHAHDTLDK